jgi:hypothetical protein
VETIMASFTTRTIDTLGEFIPMLCGFINPGTLKEDLSTGEHNMYPTEY